MTKTLRFALAAAVVFGASGASAQTMMDLGKVDSNAEIRNAAQITGRDGRLINGSVLGSVKAGDIKIDAKIRNFAAIAGRDSTVVNGSVGQIPSAR